MAEPVIHSHKIIYQAAQCGRCGCKIWPAADLEAHEDKHLVMDLFWSGNIAQLQIAIGRIGEVGGNHGHTKGMKYRKKSFSRMV